MTACPDRSELVRMLDGELTENRASLVRAHLDTCQACRGEVDALQGLLGRISAPVPVRAGAEQRILARLRQDDAPRAPDWRRWGVFALAPALAAAAVLFVMHARRVEPEGAFTARGGAAVHASSRDVDVSIYASRTELVRLRDGDRVDGATAYAVSYRNLGAPAFLAIVAADAAGDLHWIAPAYLTAGTDPTSLPLAASPRDVVLPKASVLDAPAAGPLHIFSIVTTRPLHVSEIEALPHPLDADMLRRALPGADVRLRSLQLRSSP
jgi:hypothetical protein